MAWAAASAGISGPADPASAASDGAPPSCHAPPGGGHSAEMSPMTCTPSAEMFCTISAPISVARLSAHAGVTIPGSPGAGMRAFRRLTAPFRTNVA
jgi:hypothetical protein